MTAFNLGILVHLISFILLTAAFTLTLRMVRRSGPPLPWLLLAAAFVMLSIAPVLDLYGHYSRQPELGTIEPSDMLILLGALLMLPGVSLLRRIVADRQHDQMKLHQQLDELQRFHRLAVGRELRMQELVRENAALQQRIAMVTKQEPP
ncbi:MAG: hypothetical protein PHH36_12040 [Sideroxydans sp.]|nr:hypothetical protein [Sideroxydans sp.]